MNCKTQQYSEARQAFWPLSFTKKSGNERAPWFHKNEDIVKASLNLGMKHINFVIEKWVWSGFILTFSVAVKFYL